MDFSLNDEQRMFVKMFQEFCANEVAPLAERTDHEEQAPLEQLSAAAEQGFLGALLPEEYDGAGLDWFSYLFLMEEMGKACLSTALTLNVHIVLVAYTLLRHGSTEQKDRYLPALARGDMIGGFALTEQGAGSDPAALRTRAIREGDDFVLTGTKIWVTNAGISHLLLVFARTSEDDGKSISAFLIERETPGVKVGYREKTMGLRGITTNVVYFSDCRVPASNLLGQEGHGLRIALEALDYSRIGLAAMCVGAAQAALEAGIHFATDRRQFGAPIGTKQAIYNMIADSAVEIQAMRHFTHYAAWLIEQNEPITEAAAMVKLLCSESAMRIANRMLQVHGGYGYMKEYPIERIYRDLRAMEIIEGTSQILRYVIARHRFAERKLAVPI